jgi:hypothetical protein
MNHSSFIARIRWRSYVKKSWEIDTVHRGFASAEQAALFANGLGHAAIQMLWLERGRMWGELSDGRRFPVEDTEIAVWQLPDDARELSEDCAFEKRQLSIVDLSREGLDGAFEARQFRIVTGVQGETNVEVRLNVDLARHVLRVTVECGADSRTAQDDEGSLFERVALA